MASEKKASGHLSAFLGKQAPPGRRGPAAKDAAKVPAARKSAAKAAGAAPREAGGGKRRLSDGREQLLVYLQPEGIRELKLAVLDKEAESVSAIVAEAVNTWLQGRGRQPLA